MDTNVLSELGLILLLILLNGFFAGAEIALISLRRTRLMALIEEGDQRAVRIQRLLKDPDRFFATTQIGITVVGVLASTLGGASAVQSLTPLIRALPIEAVAARAEQVALFVVVVFISYLSLVLGELTPKSLAHHYAEPVALHVIRPLGWLARVSGPAVRFLTASSNFLLRPFHDTTTFAETRGSLDELRALVADSARQGVIDPNQSELLSRAIRFSELRARDVLVPYTELFMLDLGDSPDQWRQQLLTRLHSRMPVKRGGRDSVLGWVATQDLLQQILRGEELDIEKVLQPPFFAPASLRLEALLKELQRRRLHLAMVVDEFGGLEGLVTIEDILEELVGEIYDERAGGPLWTQVGEGRYELPGTFGVNDLARLLGIESPVGPGTGSSTVGGLMMSKLERIPQVGERLELDTFALKVLERSERRVLKVEAERLETGPVSDEGA